MFYLKSKFYQYPFRNDQFYGDAVDNLLKENPKVEWMRGAIAIPSGNGKALLWNPYTALHCFINSEELNIIEFVKRGISLQEIHSISNGLPESSRTPLIKHLFLRTMVTLNGEIFTPLDIYKDRPVFEERFLIELLLSEACNLSCKYCFAQAHKGRPFMSTEIAISAIDKAMQLPVKSFTLEFGGGETFLYFDKFAALVKEIRERAKQLGKDVEVLVQTNGTLLHKHSMVEFILKNGVAIGISMDGPPNLNNLSRPRKDGRGSAKDIAKSIQLMRNHQQEDIHVLTVVNRFNVDHPDQVLDYFASLRISKGLFLPTLRLGAAVSNWEEIGISNEEFFRFMKQIIEHSDYGNNFQCLMIKRMLDNLINPTRDFRCMRSLCGAGKDYIVVDSRGNIFPCAHHVHRDDLKMGHVSDSKPLDQYSSENEFLTKLFDTRRVNNIHECSQCLWRHLCEGGCSLDSFYHHGHMLAPSTQCEYHKKMYLFLLQCCYEHPSILNSYLREEVETITL